MDRTSFRDWERHVDTGGCYVIPMGGSNALGAKGCAEIPQDIHQDYDLVCCPVGTGGTLAGLAAGLPEGKRALGFSVLKGGGFLNDEVKRLQREAFGHTTGNWSINLDFHCGGYAKRSDRLDPRWEQVYVARMMLGISTLASEGKFDGVRVVALITG